MYQTTPPQRPELGVSPPTPEADTTGSTTESSPDLGAETRKPPEASQEAVGERLTESVEQAALTPIDSPHDSRSSTPEGTSDQAEAPDLDETPPTDLDKVSVKAAEGIIDQYEGKPYEEEEAHEGLQIKYLWQRFKRKIGKN